AGRAALARWAWAVARAPRARPGSPGDGDRSLPDRDRTCLFAAALGFAFHGIGALGGFLLAFGFGLRGFFPLLGVGFGFQFLLLLGFRCFLLGFCGHFLFAFFRLRLGGGFRFVRCQFGVFFALLGFDLGKDFAVFGQFGGFFFFLFFFFAAFGGFGARFRGAPGARRAAAGGAGGNGHRQQAEQDSG